MSVRLGNNIIAGRSPQPSLFDFKWADHIISDPQWVRADTNSWQYKVAYDAAYNHLEADIEGKEAQSETVEGIIITYYLANDGHKVCLSDQVEYLDALYNTTGVAWYYIVDTINKRFKLPRTKWGFTGVRNQTSVGSYIAAGLPNITGHLLFDYGSYSTGPYNVTGAFKNNINKSGRPNTYDSNTASGDVLFDASLSNSIYGNSLTVQPQATEMYLYFFVGSFTQDALINAAAFSVESITEVLDEQTTTITETWDTASETIAANMEQLDTMINAQYHPNIFESKWSDHILNDIQWLRGDTFSWQSGEVYETAYQHLVNDYNDLHVTAITGIIYNNTIYPRNTAYDDGDDFYGWGTTGNIVWTQDEIPTTASTLFQWVSEAYVSLGTVITGITTNASQTETISGITIVYYLAADDHKIILADQENNAISIYNKTGAAWYYVLDQENTRFKLPRKHSTQIIESVKNSDGSWYKLYADGWVEQGGHSNTSPATYPLRMANTNYTLICVPHYNANAQVYWSDFGHTKTTTGFSFRLPEYGMDWQVSGQSAVDVASLKADKKYRYFYVGKFLQSAVVNTAALNMELFNGKVDIGHQVIEFQAPTEENNYTWYRKYADGWVEQGGYVYGSVNVFYNVSFPIIMSNTDYCIYGSCSTTNTSMADVFFAYMNKTVNGLDVGGRYISTNGNIYINWEVKGMAA